MAQKTSGNESPVRSDLVNVHGDRDDNEIRNGSNISPIQQKILKI